MIRRGVTEPGYIHTSEMAVRDPDPHWSDIHRALSWTFLDNGHTFYVVACGENFESLEKRPVALSSGWITGPKCPACWGIQMRISA